MHRDRLRWYTSPFFDPCPNSCFVAWRDSEEPVTSAEVMATLGANAEASNKITLSILEDLHSHVSGGKLTQAKGAMEYVCGCSKEKTLLMCCAGRCYPQGYVASRAKEAAIVCIACVLQRLDIIRHNEIRRKRTYGLQSCFRMAFAASAIS